MGEFGQDAGVTPLLFFEGHPGIFNDYRLQTTDLGLMSHLKDDACCECTLLFNSLGSVLLLLLVKEIKMFIQQ